MNPPREDEYDSLRDLMGGGTQDDPDNAPDDPADSDTRGDLPPGIPPEYAEAYRRGYESALRGEVPPVDKPAVDEPAVEPPAAEPVVDESVVGEPRGDELAAEEATVDAPPGDGSRGDELAAEEATVDAPPGDGSRGDELAAEEATVDAPPGDESWADAPPGHEPTVRIERDQMPSPEATPDATPESSPVEPAGDEPSGWSEHAATEHAATAHAAAEPLQAGPTSDESTRAGQRPPVGSAADEPTQQIPVTQAASSSSYAQTPTYDDLMAEGRSGVAPPPSYDEGGPSDEERRKRLAVIGLAALAVLLVVGAFGIGRLFSGNGTDSDEGGASSEAGGSSKAAPYEGPVDSVALAGASASCQTENSVDGAGNVVSYEPAKAYDSNLATAWRCDGSGKGQRFTVSLPEETTVAEVGLVPGYAKTDPASGVDRYAENNRITKLRWRFDDGSTYVQRIKGSPTDRDMRTMRVPETSTKRVVIEILASEPGPRNTVAISELRVASPAG